MEIEGVRAGGGASERVAALVDGYARRMYPAVLEQHVGASVSSPLGVWLLLAACVTAAGADHRTALEEVVGCSADDASDLLAAFMAAPPPALKAAIAVWVSVADSTEELAVWVRRLPAAVESGFMPTQRDADAWAEKNTLGLIKSFPLLIDATTRIVLASARLPAWHATSRLDLQASELFGTGSALEVMRELIGPRPDDMTDAAQVAVASFTRYGFEAAAVTGFAVGCALRGEPRETGTERTAVLRFDHPYAAVAIAGSPAHPHSVGQPPRSLPPFTGLPLFSAWVQEPREAEQTPPPGAPTDED